MNLTVGNTEVAAKMIQDLTGGDLFHIEAVNAYPEDYTEITEVAKQELRAKARPKLTGHLENIASYDVIHGKGFLVKNSGCLLHFIN